MGVVVDVAGRAPVPQMSHPPPMLLLQPAGSRSWVAPHMGGSPWRAVDNGLW